MLNVFGTVKLKRPAAPSVRSTSTWLTADRQLLRERLAAHLDDERRNVERFVPFSERLEVHRRPPNAEP